MKFAWAQCYPDLYKTCERFHLMELNDPLQVQYTDLAGILQEGPQCGLAALAICMRKPNKDTIDELLNDARDAGYTYNGELFSAKEFLHLVKKKLSNEVTLYSGFIDSKEIVKFLLSGGLMLVPYDCDRNHSPCNRKGHKAHWAAILGIIITVSDAYVIAKHGKSKNTAIWKLEDLAYSNSQLEEFSEDRKLSGAKYKLPEGGISQENGLKCKSICIWPNHS